MKRFQPHTVLPSRNFVFLSVALIAVMLLLFTASVESAEKAGATGPLLWPAEVDGWRITEGPTFYGPDRVYEYMDGAAEYFLAFNMKELAVLRYEKPDRPVIFLEIYRMASSQDAYGVFAFQSDDPGAGIGQGSEFGGGLLRFWKGTYFVTVYGGEPGPDVETSTLDIGRSVASSIKETGSPPPLLHRLPRETASFRLTQAWFLRSHILLNQRLFVAQQNVLDLGGDVEAVLARYESGGTRFHILLIEYPAEEKAQKALANLTKMYKSGPGEALSVRSEKGTWIEGRRMGRFLVLVFNAPNEVLTAQIIADTSAGLKEKTK